MTPSILSRILSLPIANRAPVLTCSDSSGEAKTAKTLRAAEGLIEMKYGIDAFDGSAGILKHIKDFNKILSDPVKNRRSI